MILTLGVRETLPQERAGGRNKFTIDICHDKVLSRFHTSAETAAVELPSGWTKIEHDEK